MAPQRSPSPFDSDDLSKMHFFFFQAEDGIRYWSVTGVQTCALPICRESRVSKSSMLTPLARKPTAMESTSTTSRHAIRGASFPEFVFPSSPGFTWKESSVFARKSTFTFQTKTSKLPDSQSKRRLFRF